MQRRMFMHLSSPSPGPKWEAIQEPEPSSDDELDTEDGDLDTFGSVQDHSITQRARDGRTEAARNPPQSAPAASTSMSNNTVVGDNSRSRMKRKEFESLFTSKKRARYVQGTHSDQDDDMDLSLDGPKNERHMGTSRIPAPEQKTMGELGSRQPSTSQSVSLTTMSRKQPSSNGSISPSTSTNAKPYSPRKILLMKPPPLRLSGSVARDIPSKLAGLRFDAYKRADSKSMPASDAGRSMVFASPVDKRKASVKHERAVSGLQTTRRPSTSETKAMPPDAEIIEIFEDDDSPPPSISQAKSMSITSLGTLSAPGQVRPGLRTTRIASASAPSSAAKKLLPKAPIEVIEILDSDDEELPSKAQEKNVGRAMGSNLRRGQSQRIFSSGRDSFEGGDGNADIMNIDGEARNPLQPVSTVPTVGSTHSDSENDLFNIPSSPRALSQELQVADDTNNNQATRGLIPPPSSSPSSIGFSPKDNYSSPLVPTTSIASLTISSPPQQPSTLASGSISVRKPITASPSPSASTSTGSSSNRLGFSPVAIPSSLQAPPPANKHLKQFARKMATQAILDEDENVGQVSSEPFEKKGRTNTKANKGKEKERSYSSSGTESISMRGLRDALAIDSDKVKQRPAFPILPKKQGQTLAEAITSAGQLNRTKKRIGRRLQGKTKDVPIDLTSDVEVGTKDATADENKKALKAAIGSSRLLVSLLPSLKEKNSVSATAAAAAAKLTELLTPSPQEKRLSSPTRTQDFQAKVEPPESATKIERSSYPLHVSSQKPSSSLRAEMKLNSGSPVKKIFGATDATTQPKRELSTAFEFKSGTVVIEPPKVGPPKRMPLPKRPSAATIERILTAASDNSGASQQTSSAVGSSISSMAANMFAASSASPVMTPSLIPLPLSPVLQNRSHSMSTSPFSRPTPPTRSPLAMTDASLVPGDIDSNNSLQHRPSTSTVGYQLGHASTTVISVSSPGKEATLVSVTAPKSPEPMITLNSAETTSSGPHPTAVNDSITALKAIQTLPIRLPASSIAPTSSGNAAVQDGSFDTLSPAFDDLPDDDEEECQALLQTPDYMDVVPSHDCKPSLQDGIVVRHKSHISLDTSVTSPSPSTSVSATTPEVLNKHLSVSPPIPEAPARRSSRISSGRSSRSSSSGGLGTAFNYDFGPFESVPVTRTPTPEIQELPTLLSPPKTYGGFRALTWKDFRKDLNNFTPRTYYAKDLPHALQDHINSMSEYTQMMEGMRDLFKATILENTVEDEPNAPPIEIWNNVDTQPTPPWEFYYTNNMWLGEGVPPPDIKNLVSCNCKGGCNPKSKTCACLMRQREAACDPSLEFAYDKNGKLKVLCYPIFECNDLCGCSDECRNRVVQHGRKVSVNIGKTETKGWGVFAGSKKIPDGTFIGIYSGELLTDAEAHERGVKYNKSGRTYLFDIDFHHLKEGNPLWESRFTVDAYHAGNFTRFLNHSCDPNCRLYACYINEGNIQKPLLVIFSRRDIEPFEEICFNYQGIYDDGDDDEDDEDDDGKLLDPDHGTDMIYVQCRCGAKNCTGTMFK